MRQVLHLLAIDRARRFALATRHGSRWLLPVIACGERTRAGIAAVRWCAGMGIRADVVGQWLGRIDEKAADWLLAIDVRERSDIAPAPLAWHALDDLDPADAFIEYQQWAATRAVIGRELPGVDGPFGHWRWLDDVREWIERRTGEAPQSIVSYRVGAHEVVIGAVLERRRVYVKGLTAERVREPEVTRALASVAPESFARTLAVEQRSGDTVWWLTAECPGWPDPSGCAAAERLAAVQRLVLDDGLDGLPLPELDLPAAARWAVALTEGTPAAASIDEQLARVSDAALPITWIPIDLDSCNALVDGAGGVRFIDVDDSFAGPAPLAAAILAQRSANEDVRRVYERSWRPPLRVDWSAVDTMAAVVDCWLGWDRFQRGLQRGEISAAVDPLTARMRSLLERRLYRR